MLESNTLSLNEAYRQARVLEQAQKQSASYDQPIAAITNHAPATAATSANWSQRKVSNDSKDKCYFCGNYRHPRFGCPAGNSESRTCQKRGHWAQVTKSQINAAIPT